MRNHWGHYTIVGFKKTIEGAFSPTRATYNSAGVDLRSPTDCVIPAGKTKLIDIGVRVYLPHNTYGRIAGRSSLALNHFIQILAGVIDQDYTASLRVLLANHNDKDFHILRGDKIAQLVIERIFIPKLVEIKTVSGRSESKKIKRMCSNPTELSQRMDKSFGSSGRR